MIKVQPRETKMKDPFKTLHSLGQSLWYDNIQRRMLERGALKQMIDSGEVRGMTSNPSIFNQAIAKSTDYDSALKAMAWAGYSADEILDNLVMEDIRAAADLFLPLYKKSGGADGYVSVEVRPELAHDTAATVREAHRLFDLAGKPNVMVKIPATKEGVPAVREAIAGGLNINVTLIFSLARYAEVMDAYLTGLEQRLEQGLPVDHIASVASFFISRIDSKADKLLDEIIRQEGEQTERAQALKGKLAIENARRAYALFREVFGGERFARLKAQGARLQRPLWASTSTKNPEYPDTLYVDELIGPDTINTVPQVTLDAFRDHGKPAVKLGKPGSLSGAIEEAEALGISMDRITSELETEGVKAFADAFDALMKTVEERRASAARELGNLAPRVQARVAEFQQKDYLHRLRSYDPSIWTNEPAGKHEIRNRLGWLNLPEKSKSLLPDIHYFVEQVQSAGYKRAVLLGMGGSSLAPEVNRLVFGVRPGYLDLLIIDSTDPKQVEKAECLRAEETLYIVSSKSGTTAEVKALFDYFWRRATSTVGNHAPEHFVAITDPETPLEAAARKHSFRRVFSGDPKVGGRYSALSVFGLAPSGLLGIDLDLLLDRAAWMMKQHSPDTPAGRSPGMVLGAVLGEAALAGRDKLTLLTGSELAPFGAWLEQLIAESSGKQGTGIVPIIGEPLGEPGWYGSDRVFVHLRLASSPETPQIDRLVESLIAAGHPVLSISLDDLYDVGAEYYRWGAAAAMACAVLGVNPFDQPDVQDNKDRTNARIKVFLENRVLDEPAPRLVVEGVKVYGLEMDQVDGLPSVLDRLLSQAQPGDYIALNAYLPRSPEMEEKLGRLRQAVFEKTHLPVTLGFGPRFLHSTGQLHKGGKNNGVFLQITAGRGKDLEIPGTGGMSFGTLQLAQALGDFESLEARGRRAVRLHLPDLESIDRLVEAV